MRSFLTVLLFFGVHCLMVRQANAQQLQADTIRLTRAEAENRFLQNNILLLAEKLNIDQAEASIVQARLWPNPSLDIDEVNLWATPNQLSMGEELPALGRNGFGKNRQISVQLEQVVQTAGKRRKLIALEEVSRDMAMAYYEDLLRNLKIEFRNSLTDLQFFQAYGQVFAQQLAETQLLVAAYQRQADAGNVNPGELLRLKSLQLELRHEYREIQEEIFTLQRELTVLMNLPATSYLMLDYDGFMPDNEKIRQVALQNLLDVAIDKRPDMHIAKLERSHSQNLYSFERAQKVPDLELRVGYDRGGNFLYNFVGFGLGIDIPVINRNQGNIKSARIQIDKANLLNEATSRRIESEVVAAYRNLLNSTQFFDSIEPGYDEQLDLLLGSYIRNFRNRNVSMLEFLDFFESYLSNKQNVLNARRELNKNFEELKYSIGTEIN